MKLEPLAAHHAEQLFAALSDPDVHRYLTQPDVTTLEALRERIEDLAAGSGDPDVEWLNYAIVVDDKVVGRVEATVYDEEWAELAYAIGPAFGGHGYARKAVRELVETLGLESWVSIHPENARSIRLVIVLGFGRQPTPPKRPLASYVDGDVVYARFLD